MTLRLPDSGAATGPDGRRHAPSAERNAGPILAALRGVIAPGDRVLELASGTGQHAATFAPALRADWQPTDLDPRNLASIAAWCGGATRPPLALNACVPGWEGGLGGAAAPWDAVVVVNLLHLVTQAAVAALIGGASRLIDPGGRLIVYGPFLRGGQATSPGDAAFDADLRAQDPQIGYKDLDAVLAVMQAAGLRPEVQPMPANNLLLIAFKI